MRTGLILFILAIATSVVGCGDDINDYIHDELSDIIGSGNSDPEPPVVVEPAPPPSIPTEPEPPVVEPTPPTEPPVVVEPEPTLDPLGIFGRGGNVWKPSSDGTSAGGGRLVVLFDKKYNRQFDSCVVLVMDGSGEPFLEELECIDDQPWTQIPYSCFSNGDRQTWRSSYFCQSVVQVAVTCNLGEQQVVFTVAESERANVCKRFG